MNSLGWSRRGDDEPVSTSQQSGLLSSIKSLNPFGDSGYVRLPTTESAGAPLPAPSRREEEEGWFACESMILVQIPILPQRVWLAALADASRACESGNSATRGCQVSTLSRIVGAWGTFRFISLRSLFGIIYKVSRLTSSPSAGVTQ